VARKFRLLEGISLFQQFVEDPGVADRRKASEAGEPKRQVPARRPARTLSAWSARTIRSNGDLCRSNNRLHG
jgi:hypothetical protein